MTQHDAKSEGANPQDVDQVTIIEEHPLPTDEESVKELYEENPTFDEDSLVMHPDTLREKYMEVLGENTEWRIFRCHLYGHHGYVYLWNHQLGYGIRFEDVDNSYEGFVHAVMLTAKEVA